MMFKWTIALVLAACGSLAWGQTANSSPEKKTPEPKSFFQLTFAVREMDGDKVVNSRTYVVSASTGGGSGIRAGERVPFATATGEGQFPQWQQLNVGFDTDCSNLAMVGDRLSVHLSGNLESVAGTREERNTRQPTIRTNKWITDVIVPLRKPTVIISLDDPFSTRKIQVQLTATPL